MFDLVQGFVASQVLAALVEFDILDALGDTDLDLGLLARKVRVPEDRLRILVRAATALGLLREVRGRIGLTRRSAALSAVPGLADMIRHHRVLYADLADPSAFFRGETDPALARFWPYVFGAGAAEDPDATARYSRLMADSQALVADDTLAAVDLSSVSRLMDVGGGTGAFLAEVLAAYPTLEATLFDLPAVVPAAHDRFRAAGIDSRVRIVGGSFRDDQLPTGADAVSLIRVLYDHADDTVGRLLSAVREALPPGGRLIVSEPMTGSTSGDVYYAVYTLAMGTGRARSAEEIAHFLRAAGFVDIRKPAVRRPFVTSVITAVTPSVSN